MDEFFDDEDDIQLNEHEMAWYSKDWTQIQKLADTFKQEKENVMFSIIDSVTVKKQDITQEQEEQYSKYWIDNALSQHIDCIVSVYRMNLIGSELTDKEHFRYYLHSLPKGKRYGKWAKFSEDTEDLLILSLISKYYSINIADAKMYKKIMEQKGILKKEFDKIKVIATDDFIKNIFKTKTEQAKVAKLIKG